MVLKRRLFSKVHFIIKTKEKVVENILPWCIYTTVILLGSFYNFKFCFLFQRVSKGKVSGRRKVRKRTLKITYIKMSIGINRKKYVYDSKMFTKIKSFIRTINKVQ